VASCHSLVSCFFVLWFVILKFLIFVSTCLVSLTVEELRSACLKFDEYLPCSQKFFGSRFMHIIVISYSFTSGNSKWPCSVAGSRCMHHLSMYNNIPKYNIMMQPLLGHLYQLFCNSILCYWSYTCYYSYYYCCCIVTYHYQCYLIAIEVFTPLKHRLDAYVQGRALYLVFASIIDCGLQLVLWRSNLFTDYMSSASQEKKKSNVQYFLWSGFQK